MKGGTRVAEFISSFTTGFGEMISRALPSLLPGAKILRVYNGLIHYAYPGNPKNIIHVPFFNNSYYVLRFFQEKNLTFGQMTTEAAQAKLRYPVPEGSFRVRFSKGNQFAGVDKQVSLRAENAVIKSSRLMLDRLNPATELWYVIRDEGFGFYGQLLQKRAATEKNLHPGELRPEFAWLMCRCGQPAQNSVIIDPFAGYGAIPAQIIRHFQFARLIANDIDPGKLPPMDDPRVQIFHEDALRLTGIENTSIDLVITDPPWGYYEQIDDIALFYESMLREFMRILKPDGRAVVLSARKEEFAQAIENTGAFAIERTVHTLVNGKKAGVYVLKPI